MLKGAISSLFFDQNSFLERDMKFYSIMALTTISLLNAADSQHGIQEKPATSHHNTSQIRTNPKTAQEHSKEKTKKCLTGCGFCCGIAALVACFTCASNPGNCF